MDYETYYETCMSCSGRGYHYTPDRPAQGKQSVRRRSRPAEKKAFASSESSAKSTTKIVRQSPLREATFEGTFSLIVSSGLTWLAYDSGAELPWWGWLLLFFVPLIGITATLERMPVLTRRLRKLLGWTIAIAIAGLILSAYKSGSG